MTLVAGVDSSTQSCKVVIRDAATGALVRTGRATHPDGIEVDPRFWWEALAAALAEAGGLDDVSAVGVGGQQHGMVALDADGAVVRDALLWNDTRSAQAAVDLIAELGDGDPAAGAKAWADAIGSVPVASFTVTKLRWLRDHEPELAAKVAAVALPHDWLTWRLAGYGPAAEGGVPGPVGADHRPLGRVRHRVLVRGDRGVPARARGAGAGPRGRPAARRRRGRGRPAGPAARQRRGRPAALAGRR